MDNLMSIATYEQFKQAFDGEIRKQSEGFVRLGYLIRRAADSDLLAGSGYRTIAEFAWSEYKLSADVVSRLVAVNRRYSEGGYSDRLQEKYQAYGYTLLGEMLTMSDEVVDALPDGITREGIRAVKKEIAEENKTTDLEVLLEGQDGRQQAMASNLARVLHQYYRDNTGEYPGMFRVATADLRRKGDVALLLAPSGVGVKMVRVQGLGKFMLSVRGEDQNVELVNVRSNEAESYTWEECTEAMRALCAGKNYKAAFLAAYGEEYPEPGKPAEKKAPQTPEKEAPKPEGKIPEAPVNIGGNGRFAPAQPPKKEPAPEKPAPKEEKIPESPVNTGEEAQIEGQQSLEADYEETLPEGYIRCHDGTEILESEEAAGWKNVAEKIGVLAEEMKRAEPERDPDYMLQALELVRMALEEIRDKRRACEEHH